ncbi:MAG: hypothetical protein PHG82_00065 [Candidatus Gracilibacteria bacterium]|nr:hypothetical protein [Candidatus Gracilibacteria bacterium]
MSEGKKIPKLEGEMFVLEGASFAFAMTTSLCEKEEGDNNMVFFRNAELVTTDSYLAMTYMNLGNTVRTLAG